MSISKKDFVCIAQEVKAVLPIPQCEVEREAATAVIQAVARACQRLNGNFDRSRFLAACGLDQEDLK